MDRTRPGSIESEQCSHFRIKIAHIGKIAVMDAKLGGSNTPNVYNLVSKGFLKFLISTSST